MSSDSINYASAVGIHSVAAAVVFAIAWVSLLVVFVVKRIKRSTSVFLFLVLFCVMRLSAFILRAVLASSASAGANLNAVIAEQVLYSVGFLGVLYSAYSLALDREIISGVRMPSNPLGILTGLTGNRHIVRLALVATTALGIVGIVKYTSSDSSASDRATGNTLRQASAYLFLAITILLALHTALLGASELRGNSYDLPLEENGTRRSTGSLGDKHGFLLLAVISALLLVREIYLAIVTGRSKADDETLFYVLEALPEALAVCFFAAPGLVPPASEVKEYELSARLRPS